MAKLKISGYTELIEVSDKAARKIEKLWRDTSVGSDVKVSAGRATVLKKDIKGIFFAGDDVVIPEPNYLEDYYKWRDAFVLLSPEEKSKRSAWGHFGLFYQAVFFKAPNESEWKQKAQDKAKEFYEKNTEWAHPSMKIWYELLNIPKEHRLRNQEARALLRVEQSEVSDVAQTLAYRETKTEQEQKVAEKESFEF